jgi:membrane associated rhomboid family serine protease|tara:strand:- start:2706 stop:3632 length:927 start_codon:yes stop_codon:yes gene_type:complete
MTTVLGAATRAACAFTTQRASRASARRVIPRAASLRDAQPRGPIALLPRQRRRGDLAVAGGKGPGGGAFGDAEELMKKYGDAALATGEFIGAKSGMKPAGRRARASAKSDEGNGVFLLLLINVALFVADQWLHVGFVKSLYLNHMHPRWWQFVTSIFCHANWAHLSSNIFFLYVFGKIVEEEEGAFGVWFSYLFTGIGAGLASYIMLPKAAGGLLGVGAAATVSLGASGAVFGLFAIGVLTKVRADFRKLLEAVILGQFVVERFLSEARMAAAAGGIGAGGVNHVAHLAGALVGVALIWTLQKLLPPE